MKKSSAMHLAAVTLAVLALAGCSPSGAPASSPAASSQSSQSSQSGQSGRPGHSSSSLDLKTGTSSLGTVVVDGKGRTVYYFDKDTPNSGRSACNAGCDSTWPPVTAAGSTPKVAGVTGKLGTITRDDGTKQVTVNGLPVYTYTPDTAAGDVTGQGVGGVWWVLRPNGDKVTTMPTSTSGSGGY